jgi:hypothetical protein
MRKYGPLVLAFLLVAWPLAAAEPRPKLVEDVWEVAHLEGARVGWFRTTVEEVEGKAGKVLRTTMKMDLAIKRGANSEVRLRAETGTEETPEGKVTAVSMRLPQDRGDLVLEGTVTEDGLRVKVDGGRIDKVIRWNDDVLGLYRQERLVKDRKLKPGDKFSYQSYEPTLNTVITVRGKVGEEEEVETPAGKKKLLRVEAVPDKVEVPGSSVQLPSVVLWLDGELTPVRRQMELPGLGKVVTHRTTREAALAPGTGTVKLPDILEKTLVPLNRTIPQAHDTKRVVYRVTVKGDDDAGTALARDERQSVKELKGDTFELHVAAVRSPRKVDDPEAPAKKEYLESNYFLKSDDARVKELAEKAVGEETDPLRKARAIEKWVNRNMRPDNRVGFAPADQVARGLAGDCRQHAMLTAAMCRAAGVPSKTAVGLVYMTDARKQPAMAFHMWTEVWVEGQWLAIDAVMGQGSVGAAHIKIADHSWHDTQSLTPMLPVARVLDKIKIEVVSVNE